MYWLFVFFLLVGCGGTEPATMLPEPIQTQDGGQAVDASPPRFSYVNDVQPVWDRYCVGCHYGNRRPHLNDEESLDGLLDTSTGFRCVDGKQAPLVVPGDPDRSFLMYKLTGEAGDHLIRIDCRGLMPPVRGGQALISTDPEAVERVRRWIAEGALRE